MSCWRALGRRPPLSQRSALLLPVTWICCNRLLRVVHGSTARSFRRAVRCEFWRTVQRREYTALRVRRAYYDQMASPFAAQTIFGAQPVFWTRTRACRLLDLSAPKQTPQPLFVGFASVLQPLARSWTWVHAQLVQLIQLSNRESIDEISGAYIEPDR